MHRCPLAKAACRLHAALLSYRRQLERNLTNTHLRLDGFSYCQRMLHRGDLAYDRGWLHAARLHRQILASSITETICQLDAWRNHLKQQPSALVPTPRQLLAELEQVTDEFGSCGYAGRDHELVTATGPIELEGVTLGPFEIRLSLAAAGTDWAYPCFRVVALDPNPACCDHTVCHPHVNDSQLCTGDGTATIRQALIDGRISDFFLIVRSILETYNPDSAYVSLREWDGSPCTSCGEYRDRDDLYSCRACEDDLCGSCVEFCTGCEEPFCDWHIQGCPECGDLYCADCRDRRFVDGYCEHCAPEEELEETESGDPQLEPSIHLESCHVLA